MWFAVHYIWTGTRTPREKEVDRRATLQGRDLHVYTQHLFYKNQ